MQQKEKMDPREVFRTEVQARKESPRPPLGAIRHGFKAGLADGAPLLRLSADNNGAYLLIP